MDQFIVNLTVPYISQFDSSIVDQQDACGPSCLQMVLTFLGDSVDEATLLSLTGAPQGQYLTVDQLGKAISARGFTWEYKTGLTSTDLQAYLQQGIPPIALVHAGDLTSREDQNFTGGHFVVVDGYRSDGYTCNDPDFYYDQRSQGDHHFYTKQEFETAWGNCSADGNPNNSLIIIHPKQPVTNYEELYNTCRVDRDTNWDAFTDVVSYMGITPDATNKPGTVQSAKDKIDQYKEQIAQLTQEDGDYKQKYEAEQVENVALNDALQKISTSNKDYATQTIEAQHALAPLQNDLYAIADRLHVNRVNVANDALTEDCLAAIDSLNQTIQQNKKQQQLLEKKYQQWVKALIAFFTKKLW